MSNQVDLDILYEKYQVAKQRADRAYDIMQSLLKEKQLRRKEMNQKLDRMEKTSNHYYTIWSEFHRFRHNNNARIETLRHIAEHASQSRRDAIATEIDELLQEIRDAHDEAKRRANKTAKNVYYQSVYVFEKTRERYEIAEERYRRLKAFCDQTKADYDQAKAESESEDNQDQPAP